MIFSLLSTIKYYCVLLEFPLNSVYYSPILGIKKSSVRMPTANAIERIKPESIFGLDFIARSKEISMKKCI